jgi:hypothetical protein
MQAEGLDPPALRNRPKLSAYESYFREVFDELTDSRPHTKNGYPMPIPMSEILSYFEMFQIKSLSARETALKLVRAMDRVHIRVVSDQLTAARRKQPPQ